jgi:hypothetical protein
MKIKAQIASPNKMTDNTQFSKEELKMMVNDCNRINNIPVLFDFDPNKILGKILCASQDKSGNVFIEAEVSQDIIDQYLVPGYRSKQHHIDKYGEMFAVGVTDKPCDTTLKPVKKIK